MRNLYERLVLSVILMCTAQILSAVEENDYASFVNPLVGSQSSFQLSAGNTYPAIAMPWGMNFWTPQTGKNGDGWQYVYTSHKIRGLKQTHQPSPWINDYGVFSLMPEVGQPVFDEEQRASWFSHMSEIVKPYYYKVYLADYDIRAEMTPTERACMVRLTFPKTDSASVVIDAFDDVSEVKVISEHNMVVGYSTKNSGGVPKNFRNYFIIKFDHPIAYAFDSEGNALLSATKCKRGCIVGFKTSHRGEPVIARVASSFISSAQAQLNLKELETAGNSMENIMECGRNSWNAALGRIEVGDDNIDNKRTFYSCLYRCLLFPRMLWERDSDGNVIHYSPYNGKVLPGYMYTDTGFWDTFRALFPLLNMLYPDVNMRIQEALANVYRESGFLPEWQSPGHRDCMVGNNSASVVADAWLSGVKTKDAETLWEAVVHGTSAVHPSIGSTGRRGFEYYNKLGYVPYDVNINENVARTLEYAYDDWCIYRLGKAMGKSKKALEPFKKRAMNYRNVFDPTVKMMRGRLKNGQFQSPFSPYKWGDAFTEGNSWHWTWCVFHDPNGLINLMGGRKTFNRMMDSVFVVSPIFDDSYYGQVIHEIREMQVMDMGNYAHGNQPIQHMPYLYDWSGQPWKAQWHIRDIMDRLYNANPDGYCGDEDNGQTSAWFVFSALGFYPVCPGSGEYAIGTPYFKHVVLHMPEGKTVTIDAPKCSEVNRYIDAMTVNGLSWNVNYLKLSDLKKGGKIVFNMSSQPNTSRGITAEAAPYSMSAPNVNK